MLAFEVALKVLVMQPLEEETNMLKSRAQTLRGA